MYLYIYILESCDCVGFYFVFQWLLYVPILVMATMLALVLITCIQQPFITLEALVKNIT